ASAASADTAAEQLQPLIVADPHSAMLRAQHALLLGIAATDNPSRVDDAIAAYHQLVEIEPHYSPNWANLAALYWQSGNRDDAVVTMRQAAQLADQSAALSFRLAEYLEANGQELEATSAYLHALSNAPSLIGAALWQGSPVRQA